MKSFAGLLRRFISPTRAWILFDGANSAFGTIIVTAYFVLYFKSVVVGDPHRGDFLWGLSVGGSMAVLVLLSPFLGAIADAGALRRSLLRFLTFLSVVGTLLLIGVGAGQVALAMGLFILANIGYEGGIIFYDSFLSQISTRANVGRISGYGFAVGYGGGIVALLLSIPFLKAGASSEWSRWPFVITAVQFGLLALPALFLLRDDPPSAGTGPDWIPRIRASLTNLKTAVASLPRHPDLLRVLVAYLFFNDGIATVISFAASFAQTTLNFEARDNLVLILLSNVVAVPGAFLAGQLADRIGSKRTILLSLVLWVAVVLSIAACNSRPLFYGLACLVGVGLGSTQSVTRALYSQLVPRGEEGTYFSFKGLCGKFSAITGPILFGSISYVTHSQRLAALSLVVFFVVGFVAILTVDEERGKRASSIAIPDGTG
jgi:UMF1 family MFS transporter